MNKSQFDCLLELEISIISQDDIRQNIIERRVDSRVENRAWDYGDKDCEYPCWIGVEDVSSNTAIGYCLQGFGPEYPWGLLFLKGEPSSMGMDSGWYPSLESAVREAPFWDGENPINYEVL